MKRFRWWSSDEKVQLAGRVTKRVSCKLNGGGVVEDVELDER